MSDNLRHNSIIAMCYAHLHTRICTWLFVKNKQAVK